MRSFNYGWFTINEDGTFINKKKKGVRTVEGRIKLRYGDKHHFLDRIIYEHFNNVKLHRPDKLVHLDGDPNNNALSNLKLIPNEKRVLDRNTGIIYPSAKEAAKALYCSPETISNNCNHKYGYSIYGLEVEYVD